MSNIRMINTEETGEQRKLLEGYFKDINQSQSTLNIYSLTKFINFSFYKAPFHMTKGTITLLKNAFFFHPRILAFMNLSGKGMKEE